jgi:DNA-binding transcriptional LysR family regulator
MARAGTALAVVPRMAFTATDEDTLGLCLLQEPSVTRQIGIVSRRGVPLTPAAEDLRDLVREMFHA